jgi:hypothetical protein
MSAPKVIPLATSDVAARRRRSFARRSSNVVILLRLAIAVTVLTVGIYRLASHPSSGSFTTASSTTIPVLNVFQSHSIADNPDGSIIVTEGRVTFWFPAHGSRDVPTQVAEGRGAFYRMYEPSTVEVIVANRTNDASGNERVEAERFMAPTTENWTLANWQEIPASAGKAFFVDMVLPDQQIEHVRLLVGAYSTIAVQARASDAAAPPLLDHIWSSLTVDSHPAF